MKGSLPVFLLRFTTVHRAFMPRCAAAPGMAFAALLMTLALLSGCSLFRTKPAAPVIDTTPIVVQTTEPPKIKPEEKPKPVPRKPFHPVRIRPVLPPRLHVTRHPLPRPLISTREISRATVRTLLNGEVQKPDGKVIGQAVNLITDAHGRPSEIVVNLQGFMGVGDRTVGLPWDVVRINTQPGTNAIMLAFAQGHPPVINRSSPLAATPARLPVIDAFVERANGARIGRVVDVLLDDRAVPQAVVLDVSDSMMQKGRTIAADWRALHFVVRNNALLPLLDLSDAQVHASPPYAGDLPVRAVSPTPPAAQRRNVR